LAGDRNPRHANTAQYIQTDRHAADRQTRSNSTQQIYGYLLNYLLPNIHYVSNIKTECLAIALAYTNQF